MQQATTSLFRMAVISAVVAAVFGYGGLGQPSVVHAQGVCPGNGQEYTTRAVKSGLSGVTSARSDIIWANDQDIVVNGPDYGHTRLAVAVVGGEGTGLNGGFRLEAGLMRRKIAGTLEDILYAVCVGAYCRDSGVAFPIAYDWSETSTYIVGFNRPNSSSGGYYDWVAQFALKSGGLTNLGAITLRVSSSVPAGNRVSPMGAMQRDTGQSCFNCYPNSIGHGKLNRVFYKNPDGYFGIGSVTTSADPGYWMTNSGCAANSYQTGTNTGCSGSHVGNGLSSGCN